MPNNPRRRRTDSTANIHRILAGSNIEIVPPLHVPLTDADWPFWHDIVDEFARADWTPHQLDLAAILSRTMAMLEAAQRHLATEGSLLSQPDGSMATNPRAGIVSRLTGQVLALRRSLGLTGRALAGSSEEAARKRIANRKIERAASVSSGLLS